MERIARKLTILIAVVAASLATSALAAPADAGSSSAMPEIGQPSKDSVWVPTPQRMIHRLLQLADVTSRDVVLDLGSGDGRIPIYAAKHFGARAIGVELEPNLVALSEAAARDAGVSKLVRFVRQDLFDTDLAQASVITLYISPGVMTKLKPRLLALRPGTRLVSHQFTLDDWAPDETIRTENRNGYLWVVPPDVRGSWAVSGAGDPLRIQIDQKHQALTVRAERGGRPVHVLGARVRGTEIEFSSFDADGGARQYRGDVTGACMRGESTRSGAARGERWMAVRSGAGC